MKLKHIPPFLILATLLGTLLVSCKSSSPTAEVIPTPPDTTTHTTSSDSLVYSFIVLGCNRLDKADVNTGTNPSTANLAQLDRTFADAMALTPRPDFIFLTGDLILGKVNDAPTLDAQLQGWCDHYRATLIAQSGIRLVVIPGNHETNDGDPSGVGETEWLKIMAPYIMGSNGPKANGPDGLATDQSRLSYSFDYKGSHFVLLNSDATGATATVPVRWLASDLAQAHNAGAAHIFAFAHKPAYSWDGKPSDGLATSNRDSLWSLLVKNKAEAMFAAHNHIYRRLQPTGNTSMVIAGNGGSSLASTSGTDRNFGFTRVAVYTSGTVRLTAYARDYGTNYYDPSPVSLYPTTVRDTANLTWRW